MVKNSKTIDLKSLNLEELSGIISIYPWFTLARIELCRRMAALGKDAWGEDKYASQALYAPCRKKVFEIMRSSEKVASSPQQDTPATKKTTSKQIYVIGGDYFSAEQYAATRKEEDNIFSSFISKAKEQNAQASTFVENSDSTDFCTEELAKVYLQQGYPDKAKEIYSKLSLRIPEKSIYFASLIEKIEKQI